MRVGINGFGRIGRAIARINLERNVFDLVAVNDVNPDPSNVAYLLKYDSVYGRLRYPVNADGKSLFLNNGRSIALYCHEEIDAVPWADHNIDILIEATGVDKNLKTASQLPDPGFHHCIVTNSPDNGFGYKPVIVGVNEESVARSDRLLSSSICDANAVVPVLDLLDRNFGIEYGFLTTLHPWLNYQNLLDGPALSFSDPGSIHSTYVLGRASAISLIPKTTSCLKASSKVLKGIDEKFISLSYRVPTMIVSSADIMVKLREDTSRDDVIHIFENAQKKQNYAVLYNNYEALVSIDFVGFEHSSILDHRWTTVHMGSQLKLVLWYDNEWGYGSRVVDLIDYLAGLYAK